MKITGVSIFINTEMIPATFNATFSAWSVAMVFGEISPKIRISRVMIPVAIPT